MTQHLRLFSSIFPRDFLSPLKRKTCQFSHVRDLYDPLRKETSRLDYLQTNFAINPLRKRLITKAIHEFFVNP